MSETKTTRGCISFTKIWEDVCNCGRGMQPLVSCMLKNVLSLVSLTFCNRFIGGKPQNNTGYRFKRHEIECACVCYNATDSLQQNGVVQGCVEKSNSCSKGRGECVPSVGPRSGVFCQYHVHNVM